MDNLLRKIILYEMVIFINQLNIYFLAEPVEPGFTCVSGNGLYQTGVTGFMVMSKMSVKTIFTNEGILKCRLDNGSRGQWLTTAVYVTLMLNQICLALQSIRTICRNIYY